MEGMNGKRRKRTAINSCTEILADAFSLRILTIAALTTMMLIGLFCATLRCELVSAEIVSGDETDVIITIDSLMVKPGVNFDWLSYSDPYVFAEIRPAPARPGFPYPPYGAGGNTPYQREVPPDCFADKLHNVSLALKYAGRWSTDGKTFYVMIHLQVIDADPDTWGQGQVMYDSGTVSYQSPQNWISIPYSGDGTGVVVVENENIWLRITYRFVKACTGEKVLSPASNQRVPEGDTEHKRGYVEPGQLFGTKLALDINETSIPENVAITELIPPKFTYIGASLDPEYFHETMDGVDLTFLKWEFTGTEVQDRNITYTLLAPAMGGVTTPFFGEIIVDNCSFVTWGQQRILVSTLRSAYEQFGPRLDELLIRMYADEAAEFTALENGEIDIIDDPLTDYWINRWSVPPYNENIVLSNYAGGSKAFRKQYSGGTGGNPVFPDDGENTYRDQNWEGLINQPFYGINSLGTFLSAHPEGYERGDGSNAMIRYGFSNPTLEMLNPIYSTSHWDWEVLDKIYDRMIIHNSSDLSIIIPWLAQNYTTGTWLDPQTDETKTKISITLRHEATWADGMPITFADVYFTFIELPDILEARGYPLPTWISNLWYIKDFKTLDPYNFEVLLNVLEPLATDLFVDNIILPKHVWKPIVMAGDPTTFAPDPNLIGSGPWRLKEYDEPLAYVLMVANHPNSTVQTDLPDSNPIRSPQGYWRYNPTIAEIGIDAGTLSKIDCCTQPHSLSLKLSNCWYDGPITIDMRARITWFNGTITEDNIIDIVLNAKGTVGDNYVYSKSNLMEGKIKNEFTIHVKDPLELAGTLEFGPLVIWGTIKEDIVGSTLYDEIGFPTYAYKSELPSPDFEVDLKDISNVARAFGSYPGNPMWSTLADINADYYIDMKDISSAAKKFGWPPSF